MSIYHRLPPISRTPSPPAHTLRRLQAFGGATLPSLPEEVANSDGEDDGSDWNDAPDTPGAGPSTKPEPAAPPPARKKRKAKKRFLSLGKDPNGKWKKRKLLEEERAIQKALEVTVAESENDDDDMLESINVAGGFLLIGEGSANPRPVAATKTGTTKRRRPAGTRGRGRGRPPGRSGSSKSKTPAPSLESRITTQKPKAFVKGPMRFKDVETSSISSLSEDDEDATILEPELAPESQAGDNLHLNGDNTPSPLPKNANFTPAQTAVYIPPIRLQSEQPAPPEPPPTLFPKPPRTPIPPHSSSPAISPTALATLTAANEAARALTFHIYKFPDLATSWQISGRDMCPPGVLTRPLWSTLSLIVQRKLASRLNPSTQRILLNWTFPLASQANLDDAIDELILHGRNAHDVVLIDLDSRGGVPRKVAEMVKRLKRRDAGFWKGRETGGVPGELVEFALKPVVVGVVEEQEMDMGIDLAPDSTPASPKEAPVKRPRGSSSIPGTPTESKPSTRSSSRPTVAATPPPPTGTPGAAIVVKPPQTEPPVRSAKRKLSDYFSQAATPFTRTASAQNNTPVTPASASPTTRSRITAAPSSASRWRSGGGVVEAGTQTAGQRVGVSAKVRINRGIVARKEKEKVEVKVDADAVKEVKRKEVLIAPSVVAAPVVVENGGKVTLAEAMRRQKELREKGKERAVEVEKGNDGDVGIPVGGAVPRDEPRPLHVETKNDNGQTSSKPTTEPLPPPPPPQKPAEPDLGSVAKPVMVQKKTWDSMLRTTPTLGSGLSQKKPRGRPKGSSSVQKAVGVMPLAPAPAPAVGGTPVLRESALLLECENFPGANLYYSTDFFHPPAPVRASPPEIQPKPPAVTVTKEPTREERFRAVVAAAINDAGTESRIGNYQRAARSGNDALRVVAERKLETGATVQADKMDVDIGAKDAGLTVPEFLDEESGSAYTPSTPGSMSVSVSTGTDIVQLGSEEKEQFQRERSVETVEAAVTLNAVASEPSPKIPQVQQVEMTGDQTSEGAGASSEEEDREEPVEEPREEDGQSQSVDIMHGADLLLWAAGAVDPNFGQHAPTQDQHENARETVAAAAISVGPAKKQRQRKLTVPKLKLKVPKEPKEPKIPKSMTKAKVTKTRTPKEKQRRKSLIVTLKVRSNTADVSANGGEGSSTGSPSHLTPAADSTPMTTSPGTPNWLTASPSVSGFTPVNIPTIPTASIPRPQPYRKPESSTSKPITPKPVMIKPRTSAVDALAAARKQTEQAKSAKLKGVGSKAGNGGSPSPAAVTNSPNTTSTITTTTVPASPPVPSPAVQEASPRVVSSQAVITPQSIPRPAYAKPGPTSTESPGNTDTPDAGPDMSPAVTDTPSRPSSQPITVPLTGNFSTHPVARKFFATFSSGRNDQLDGQGDTPPPPSPSIAGSASAPNTREHIAAGTRTVAESSSPANAAGGAEKAAETAAGPSRSGAVSADVTRNTSPFLGPSRATLTPEYIETKKIVPLVGKGNFLYWEPSMGGGQTDVKPLIGKSPLGASFID